MKKIAMVIVIVIVFSIVNNLQAQIGGGISSGTNKHDSLAVQKAPQDKNKPIASAVPESTSAGGTEKTPVKETKPVFIYPNAANTSFITESNGSYHHMRERMNERL